MHAAEAVSSPLSIVSTQVSYGTSLASDQRLALTDRMNQEGSGDSRTLSADARSWDRIRLPSRDDPKRPYIVDIEQISSPLTRHSDGQEAADAKDDMLSASART